jgi:ABC-type transport system substrate-binding protein
VTAVDFYVPDTADPAQAGDLAAVSVLAAAYDGLVAFRRSGGAQGFTLVPDLARTLPRPAGGGTTYTFTLRRGIRYSNGALVRASDFRRGMQRQLSFGATPGYFEGILGAPACEQHPERCDLSAGILTDDTAGTVTIRLGQADPDFLDKLALLGATPAPPGAPAAPFAARRSCPAPARTWSRNSGRASPLPSCGTRTSASGPTPHSRRATRLSSGTNSWQARVRGNRRSSLAGPI